MRIALVSDIHGNLPALEAVVADIRRQGADLIVNLGDSLSGPLLPRETAQYLMAQGWPTLAGNHERQLLAITPQRPGGASDQFARERLGEPELTWLRSLPQTLRPVPDLLLCHGSPRSDCEYFLETLDPAQGLREASEVELEQRLAGEQAAVVACGHSHLPRQRRHASGQLLVNPGSVGLQAYRDEEPWPHEVVRGGTEARYALLTQGAAGWQVQLRGCAYPHQVVADLARQHGRPDWARALATGRN